MSWERVGTGSRAIAAVALIVVATAGLCGCFGKQAKQTPLMRKVGTVRMTAEELRLRMRNGAAVYAGVIEDAANEIMRQTDDSRVRRDALMWKARAIPTAQQAMFDSDPLVALVDTWAFTLQMLEFFETGAGKDTFGDLQPIAIDTCRRLDEAVEALVLDAANEKADIPRAKEQVSRFVLKYPIETLHFNRESVPAHMDAFNQARSVGGLAAAGTLVTDMSDLSARIGLLSNQMPRQIMWESELLAETYITRREVDRSLADIHAIPASVDNLRLFAQDSVGMALAEKDALLDTVGHEMESLGEAFESTLVFVSGERQAVVAALQAERETILEALKSERQLVLDTIGTERALVMDGVGTLSGDAIGQLETRLEKVIDHFFLRLVQLLGGLIVVGGVGAFVLLRALRPARP